MKNEFKQGLLVGCGVGVLAFALGTAPAQAAEPSSRPMAPDPSGAMPQPKAEKTGIAHASVEVASIDKTARKITVKMPNGEKAQIQVPTDVQEFDKLKVGDRDRRRLHAVGRPRVPAPGNEAEHHRARGRRAGMAGRQMSVSAEVIKVDPASNQVTFKGPKGTHRIVTVQQDPGFCRRGCRTSSRGRSSCCSTRRRWPPPSSRPKSRAGSDRRGRATRGRPGRGVPRFFVQAAGLQTIANHWLKAARPARLGRLRAAGSSPHARARSAAAGELRAQTAAAGESDRREGEAALRDVLRDLSWRERQRLRRRQRAVAADRALPGDGVGRVPAGGHRPGTAGNRDGGLRPGAGRPALAARRESDRRHAARGWTEADRLATRTGRGLRQRGQAGL